MIDPQNKSQKIRFPNEDCNSRLENIRKMIIIRTIKWNCKQRDNGTPDRIKIHYKAEEYAFIEEYIKTKKFK